MENNQIKQGGEDNIQEQIKDIFKKEGLTWEKIGLITGDTGRSNTRRRFLTVLNKANALVHKIGYKIKLEPIKPK